MRERKNIATIGVSKSQIAAAHVKEITRIECLTIKDVAEAVEAAIVCAVKTYLKICT